MVIVLKRNGYGVMTGTSCMNRKVNEHTKTDQKRTVSEGNTYGVKVTIVVLGKNGYSVKLSRSNVYYVTE
jgi:hypothetical protein